MNTCKDVMTSDLVCCSPGDTVVKAAELMKQKNIGPVLVIEDARTPNLVGIVTDRDLAMKVVAEGRDVHATRVESVMSRDLVTCRADDPLDKALDAMARHQLRRIPIVDADGYLRGIIAQADVATRLDEPAETAEVVREISQENAR